MPTPKGAGRLIELVAFDKRALVDDGYGNNVSGDWIEQFRCHAAYVHLRGSETVLAARLESHDAMVVRVRVSDASRLVTADWQLRDVRRGAAYNIRTITDDNSRAWIDLLVESDVATG